VRHRRKEEDKTGDQSSPLQKRSGQYFEGAAPEAWSFLIGRYQDCERWLKDCGGRAAACDDQMRYCKVVPPLHETTGIMAEIDPAIPQWKID
jgi:hypothetical protein